MSLQAFASEAPPEPKSILVTSPSGSASGFKPAAMMDGRR
jgi:hypothetical protein